MFSTEADTHVSVANVTTCLQSYSTGGDQAEPAPPPRWLPYRWDGKVSPPSVFLHPSFRIYDQMWKFCLSQWKRSAATDRWPKLQSPVWTAANNVSNVTELQLMLADVYGLQTSYIRNRRWSLIALGTFTFGLASKRLSIKAKKQHKAKKKLQNTEHWHDWCKHRKQEYNLAWSLQSYPQEHCFGKIRVRWGQTKCADVLQCH